MRWLAKAAVQAGISAMPNADAANYVFQRRVTRNLPRNRDGILQHAEEAAAHVLAYEQHTSRSAGEARAYEFGAGWDLVGPLSAYCLGVDSQTLIDIRPNLRLELVEDAINQLRDYRDTLQQSLGRELRELDPAPLTSVEDLQRRFGITYVAPLDARSTGLPEGRFDLISSTFTMEHIPQADLAAILRESARLLAPDGLMSSSIDMKDHYSYFDESVPAFNFLRFSDRRWRLFNPSIHFQNRLRRSDYLQLFAEAGHESFSEETVWASAGDLEGIESLPPAERFRRYDPADRGARELRVLSRA